VAAARAIVRDLRARRHVRSPGATARDLIERTGLGRVVQAQPNGRQTLGALYEVAFEIERRAQVEGLDFDQATRLPRDWADVPVFLPVPEPLGDDAVRIMTVHQAKGLEFPVVVLWDGFQSVDQRGARAKFWVAGRDGRSWALNLAPVTVEEPEGSAVAETEKGFDRHERARLYYVAATRARDLLVLPLPKPLYGADYATEIMAGADDAECTKLVSWFEPYRPDAIPGWARPESGAAAPVPSPVRADPELDRALAAGASSFAAARARAAAPRAVPRAVTAAAHVAAVESAAHVAAEAAAGDAEIDIAAGERAAKSERSRHGQHFGIAVHRALELVLGGADLGAEDAVRVAIEETGLALRPAARQALIALHGDVEADVERALAALARAGLRTLDLATEVDVTAVPDDETLLRGAIDLLAVGPDVAYVIDWKTDQPIRGALATAYPAYAEQLRLYAAALRAAGWLGPRTLRTGLLLTAAGEIRWLD
jgi:ATP-dependent helicase/nuclease subunit A